MIFSWRPTAIYDLPLRKDTVIIRPESAILRFPNGKSTDFGALCFLRREATPKYLHESRRQSEGRRVELNSFSADRAKQVKDLIIHISDDLAHSGRRVETVRDYTTRFVAFMFWADSNGYHDVLNCAEIARRVIQDYARNLRERVMTNTISINGAARQQNTVYGMLSRFLEVDNLTRGINLLRKNPATTVITAPPNQDSQSRVLALCESIFDGLASFALNAKPYPYALDVPEFLNYPRNTIWIFPTTSWFMPKYMLLKGMIKWSLGFNYNEGRVSTANELQAIGGHFSNKQNIHNAINKAKRQLLKANSDKNHIQRRHLGMIALNTFILLFLAQTGINWAQLVSIELASEYEISAKHQAFRTIKWRAGGKIVSFELPVSFMPRFKKFLDLRKYVLGENFCDSLFFTLGANGNGLPVKIRSSGPNNIHQTLRRIDPDLPAIMPRQWRAAKSDWLIRNTDPSTTALILQNSEKTVLAHYAAGSETSQLEELSGFFNKLSETVLNSGQIIEGGTSSAVGYCSSYGAPNKTVEQPPVQLNCKGPEGCLFCEKFKVHTDEKDTRKLISCRYCLRQTAHLAGSHEDFTTTLAPIFKKIEDILAEISRRDEGLVLRVSKEVEEDGELDPYWARKLEMLMELGLVV